MITRISRLLLAVVLILAACCTTDSSKPWQYFRQGKPLASLAEKGRGKLTSSEKFKKVYLQKKVRANRRKNAAFGDLDHLNLMCFDGG